jgi:hypothetical protein
MAVAERNDVIVFVRVGHEHLGSLQSIRMDFADDEPLLSVGKKACQ